MMTFGAPLLLLGLLAVAIPVVIHLIWRRKGVRRPFPAMALLLRSERRMAPGLKIKQLLLLASRIAFFVLLSLAMAQPFLDCGGGPDAAESAERLPQSLVIVLDESASMSWRSENAPSLFEEAREEARRQLRSMRPWDQVAVIGAGGEPRVLLRDGRRGEGEQALQRIAPRHGDGDLPLALGTALELHRESMLPARRTLVFTDRSPSAWEATRLRPEAVEGLGLLEIMPVGDSGRSNVSVEDLHWEQAPEEGPEAWRIHADLQGWEVAAGATVQAELLVEGERQATTTLSFDESGRARAVFVHPLPSGDVVRVGVRLRSSEGMSADALREAPIRTRGSVRVLLVNGDVRSVPFYDELFYLERALAASGGGGRPYRTRTIHPERMPEEELDGFDVVVLANVASLPSASVDALEGFVRAGGGVLLTMGDQIRPESWNTRFQALSPQPLRTRRVLGSIDDPEARIQATRLATVDRAHPIFRIFTGAGGESLQAASAYSYMLLEPARDSDVRTLASFGDGAPALVERSIGQGRVLLWTTSIDMDWNDLPLRSAFVPFVHRVLDHLAGQAASRTPMVPVDAPHVLTLEQEGEQRLTVVDPEGERHVVQAVDGRARFVPRQAGVHEVWIEERGVPRELRDQSFAAHVPRHQSDPRVIPEGAEPWLEAAGTGAYAGAGEGDAPRGLGVWPSLLFLLLLVIYLESLLSLRRRVWERLRVVVFSLTGKSA